MLKSKLLDWIVMTTRDAAWAPSLVFLAHAVASLGFHAYQRWPSLDIPMHFLGGVVICYFYHRASINASAVGLLGPFHRVTHVILVFALVATTTVFWEFAEYISDQVFGTHAQVDLEDTLLDMLLGIVGGVVFLTANSALRPARRLGS
ncbi:hypothetical protein [Paludisphaera rhizosphaerae]|uniref:hypothetical protein n=1 Tax=Paludisphaera rhizosphaerae TaxID=2711216 RepID=UPI0013ECE3C9|nr:hypothetical protein [Paludisphaera rhizosphaerae]